MPVPSNAGSHRRSRARRLALPGAAIAALTLLSSCAKDAPQDTFQPKGDNARNIDNLQRTPFYIAGGVFVIVFFVVMFCVFKFRDRGQKIPKQTHGKPALEIALTILPALILIGVGIPTVKTLFMLAKTSDTQCVINVTGQQWWWEYDYPVQAGCGGITEPIVTSGEFVFPAKMNVLLKITSRDVIHSFWIPALNGKRDAVPGRVQTLRMEADQPGIYAGQCTEFCGLSHAYMRMDAVALDAASFETWKTNQLAAYESPADGTPAKTGESTFLTQCSRCHQVNGLVNADGDPVISRPDQYVYSGAAPNLTNLMTRFDFAGASFDLITDDCRDKLWSAKPADFSALYLKGVTPECFDPVNLREWLRNAPGKKPMYADPTKLGPTDGKTRGMPNLNLTEDQIDQIISYLTERK
ncbi:MAG: cytochrome c oxidase subunit [Ilumatobacteraceae bacterium]|nr:cytochrome c oxidase subunit [Ilumatobacteraceae bacterium]MCU1387139.1 cytochrome c oxidase subunit [Ilumatobacteraceae bacterium]